MYTKFNLKKAFHRLRLHPTAQTRHWITKVTQTFLNQVCSKKHPLNSVSFPQNSSQSARLYSGQLWPINCHRPGVNWQLRVVTCAVFAQHYGEATVPKAVPRPPSVALPCVDVWPNLSGLVSQSAGTDTHLNPPAHTGTSAGQRGTAAHRQALHKI